MPLPAAFVPRIPPWPYERRSHANAVREVGAEPKPGPSPLVHRREVSRERVGGRDASAALTRIDL